MTLLLLYAPSGGASSSPGFKSFFFHWLGGNVGGSTFVPPSPTAPVTGGAGPGWKLFGHEHEDPAYHPTWTKRRHEFEKLERALTKAEDADTRSERRVAAKELKQVVAEFVAMPVEQEVQFIEALKQAQQAELSLSAYVAAIADAMARWDDDMEAMRIIMELA